MLYGVPPPPASTVAASAVPPQAAAAPVAAPPTGLSTAGSATGTPSISSNAQAALMILLTAQMQSQSGEPSVLQNPQVVSILQTLVNNADKSSDMNELVKDPSLAAVFSPVGPTARGGGSGSTAAAPGGQSINLDANRPALLDTPRTTRPILLGNAPPPAQAPPLPPSASTNDDLTASAASAGLDNLLNAQNLNQLLGVLNTPPTHSEAPKVQAAPAPPPQAVPQAVPVVSVASVQPQSLLPTPSSTGFMQVINVTNDCECL